MEFISPIINSTKEFLKPKFNFYLVLALAVLGIFMIFGSFLSETSPVVEGVSELEVYYFFLPTCPHCAEQKPIIYELQEEFDEVNFYFYDASLREGSGLFYKMVSEAGLDTSGLGVPATFINGKAFIGVHSKQELGNTIINFQENSFQQEKSVSDAGEVKEDFRSFELPFFGETDLMKFSIPVLAVVLGLIDGFNPCAMWVLVYLIALIININDRKKIWIIVGSFVLASGILYFLFMTAWINIFLLIGYMRSLTIIIGIVALGGGIFSLKEYLTTKGALVCKVGNDDFHKKTSNRIKEIINSPLSISIIFSIIVLAFIVNSIEFACSSAIPAVFTQILAISNLSTFQHYLYIALYTFFFMLDDLVIFGLAAFAVTGTSIGDKYAKYCKAIGGIILVILGLILLFAPNFLR